MGGPAASSTTPVAVTVVGTWATMAASALSAQTYGTVSAASGAADDDACADVGAGGAGCSMVLLVEVSEGEKILSTDAGRGPENTGALASWS